MSFVGIIADSKDYEFIKKELFRGRKYSKLELINIHEKNIENIKNIKFETIAICRDIKEMRNGRKHIDSILKNAKYLIINSDIHAGGKALEESKIQIITYGMNQKATITASSVEEDSILICVQRNIENLKSNIIEMQEFKAKSENITNKKVYSLLVLFIIEQLYG